MGELTWLSQAGDETIEWDPKDEVSTQTAKDKYTQLLEDGYEFFEVAETKGKRVKRWNKKLGKIIAAPGVQSQADIATGQRPAAMAGGPNQLR